MAAYTQSNRLLSVSTPLGDDVLLLTGFTGREELSRPFSYRLEMLSEQADVAAKDVVGQPVSWSVTLPNTDPRYFHGRVRRFEAGPWVARNLRSFRAEVVPWFWFLTRSADCRIFQNLSATDIIGQVFDGLGFTDYDLSKLTATYAKREYCVQYRETAFDFVSRLMEYEGIFYFFQHEQGKHTLVLGDAASAYPDCPESTVAYSTGPKPTKQITAWEHRYEFRSGKWTQTDYNFTTPSTSLLSSTTTVLDLPGASNFELFDYPGLYQTTGAGGDEVKVRMAEEEAGYDVASGTSQCCTFSPGAKFTLEGHPADAENQAYALLAVEHTASDPSYTGTGGQADYGNTFRCVPASVTFRPERLTPRALVRGPQTAVVVGPSGSEIYTDQYGRVKVQFFWDRLGQKDENSSCWIRVAQNWAGKGWGVVFNPRIGQEVIVDFLEGDPDRPIITGRVYNAEQTVPYTLPDNQTQSTVKSRSSKGGSTTNFNELRFEDKKGSEEVYFHAERDFNRVVENNDTLKVGSSDTDTCPDGSQTIEIWKDRTETVKTGNESVSIEQGNRTVTVKQGNQTLKVETGNREVTVDQGDDTHTVKTGNRLVTVQTGNDTHEVKTGNREVTIDTGNDTLTIKTGNQTTTVQLGASSTEAMQSITLKVGENSIKIDNTGITLEGMNVVIKGQVQTQLAGVVTQIQGTAVVEMKGGIVQIN